MRNLAIALQKPGLSRSDEMSVKDPLLMRASVISLFYIYKEGIPKNGSQSPRTLVRLSKFSRQTIERSTVLALSALVRLVK